MKHSFAIKLLALVLVLLMLPTYASAAVISPMEPYASDYLDSYNTYMYAAGGGEVQVWFRVTGDKYMDDIGTLSIFLYESTDDSNWTHIKTYQHEDYSEMLAEGKIQYTSHVSYDGVAGRYYKAYVCIWAGKDGGGDTRYMWATSIKAT